MFGSYHREIIVNDLSIDARIFDSLVFHRNLANLKGDQKPRPLFIFVVF